MLTIRFGKSSYSILLGNNSISLKFDTKNCPNWKQMIKEKEHICLLLEVVDETLYHNHYTYFSYSNCTSEPLNWFDVYI